ncbi:S8/S53 family peptidase [Paraliomyxa miuraensis]|uniref:S8/S53 family peptidase n=1 Tax=Paraliomyxa miuraensis TaxID=376150 RepID=UPI0022591992|nr:S8/S53 family peptidase [Paraliomyxa miuraensis]MCX4244789.1 S8/S53 family peptidase [Paraliomyxa miuraensis]
MPDLPSTSTTAGGSTGGPIPAPPIPDLELDRDPSRPLPRSFVAKIVPGESCPTAPPGWDLSPPPTVSSTRLTELLARYCAYQLPSDVPHPGSMPSLSAPPGAIERIAADYAVVLPQATVVRGTGEARQALFRERMGVSFVHGATNVADADRPYVAIVDTADPDTAWPGSTKAQQHGLIMGGIVSEIRCPEDAPGCDSGRVFYEQAFPSIEHDPTALEARGTVWSLNLAVLEAIEHWRDLHDDAPLVLNMSVGWPWDENQSRALEERQESLLSGRMRGQWLTPSEEALLLTLSWASCQRVLAIAAAGNTRGGACAEEGPMAPAAWEDLTPPSFDQCQALLDPADHDALGTRDEFEANRLVYSAGGIDANEQPIVNARPLSQPKRVLYASMVSVPTGDAARPYSMPLTGTSVASAALSGIAAQYWGMHPELRPAQVIEAITNGSSTIDSGSAAQSSSAQVPVIRADQMLSGLYTRSSNTYEPPSIAFQPATPDPDPNPNPTQLSLSQIARVTRGSRECTSYAFAGAGSTTDEPWPELAPQPQTPICPTCDLSHSATGGATLDVAVDPEFEIITTTAVLELHLPSGSVTQVSLDLEDPCSNPQEGLNLRSCPDVKLSRYAHPSDGTKTLSDYVVESDVGAATLSFYVTEDRSTQLYGNEIDVFDLDEQSSPD